MPNGQNGYILVSANGGISQQRVAVSIIFLFTNLELRNFSTPSKKFHLFKSHKLKFDLRHNFIIIGPDKR